MFKQLATSIFVIGAMILAPIVASAEIKLYGQGTMYGQDGSKSTDELQWKSKASRVGIKGTQKLNENLSFFGKIELGVDLNASGADSTVSGRYGYIGLNHKGIGSISVGRVRSIFDEFVSGNSDIFTVVGAGSLQAPGSKISETLKFERKFMGADVAFLAQSKSNSNDGIDFSEIGALWNGIGVVLASDDVNSKDYYGLGYTLRVPFVKSLSLGSTYSVLKQKSSADVKAVELSANYKLGGDLSVLAAVGDTNTANDDGFLALGVEKGLGKNAKLFVELERDRDSDDNTYAAGFKLVF